MQSTIRQPLHVLLFVLLAFSVAAGRQHSQIGKTALRDSALRAGHDSMLAVVVKVDEGLHAQSHTPLEENYIKFELKLDDNAKVKFDAPIYPPGKIENYPDLGKLSVYTGSVTVFVPVSAKADAAVGDVEISGKVSLQACDDRRCFQPESQKFTLNTKIVAADAAVTPTDAELFKDAPKAGSSGVEVPVAPPAKSDSAAAPVTIRKDLGYVLFQFGIALLAGVLFNAMPCVLPVLPLKAIGFYNAAQHSRTRSIAFGVWFSIGVIATFAVFGVLIFGLKQFDWGGLFSHRWFQISIVVILLGLSASTFGVFTVNVPTVIYSVSPRHDTYFGNFLFGILTAVLSTPCTFGVFVGLLTWAIGTGSVIIGEMMLVAVGVGMALPYLILSAMPNLARKFPRTGAAGEVVKMAMALMLLVAAAYFARPLVSSFLHGSAFWWTLYAVIGISVVVLIGRTFQLMPNAAPRLTVIAMACVVLYGSGILIRRAALEPFKWEPFSESALAAAKSQNRLILVEFTADWCMNCQYVEAAVLHSRQIVKTVGDRDVLMLKADVTSGDAAGRPLLDKLDRAGSIPLTVIYPKGNKEPVMLNGIYSVSDLQNAIDASASGEALPANASVAAAQPS